MKLLFVPCARAVSTEVCEALRRYVAAGGVLVADVRPAVLAGNCAPLGHSQLADLLGVKIGAEPKATSPLPLALKGEYRWAGGALRFTGLTLPRVVGDASVELAGGEALGKVGETPAVICQRQGRGLAVLLNFGLDDLGAQREGPSVGALSDIVRALADAADVVPQAEVIGADGNPLPDCRLARFRYGNAIIHGILLGPSHGKPQTGVLRLAHAAHLYETRMGEYLGKSMSLPVQLVPAHGRLLCALPEKLDALRLAVPSSTRAGQEATVEIRLVGGGAAGPHLIRVHVIGPEGKLRRHYSRSLTVDGQSAGIAIPFAFNDDSGAWTVEAREVATGVRARATLRLTPAP